MARDVVDEAMHQLPEPLRPGPSRTEALPLVGARGTPPSGGVGTRSRPSATCRCRPWSTSCGGTVTGTRTSSTSWRTTRCWRCRCTRRPRTGGPRWSTPWSPRVRARWPTCWRRRTRLAVEVADGGDSVGADVRVLTTVPGWSPRTDAKASGRPGYRSVTTGRTLGPMPSDEPARRTAVPRPRQPVPADQARGARSARGHAQAGRPVHRPAVRRASVVDRRRRRRRLRHRS